MPKKNLAQNTFIGDKWQDEFDGGTNNRMISENVTANGHLTLREHIFIKKMNKAYYLYHIFTGTDIIISLCSLVLKPRLYKFISCHFKVVFNIKMNTKHLIVMFHTIINESNILKKIKFINWDGLQHQLPMLIPNSQFS